MAEDVGHQWSDVAQYPGQKCQGEQPSKKVIHSGQGTPLDPLSQTGELNMHVGWSRIYESFEWICIYGCSGTDCDSRWEAEQAFLNHTCTSVADPV